MCGHRKLKKFMGMGGGGGGGKGGGGGDHELRVGDKGGGE